MTNIASVEAALAQPVATAMHLEASMHSAQCMSLTTAWSREVIESQPSGRYNTHTEVSDEQCYPIPT